MYTSQHKMTLMATYSQSRKGICSAWRRKSYSQEWIGNHTKGLPAADLGLHQKMQQVHGENSREVLSLLPLFHLGTESLHQPENGIACPTQEDSWLASWGRRGFCMPRERLVLLPPHLERIARFHISVCSVKVTECRVQERESTGEHTLRYRGTLDTRNTRWAQAPMGFMWHLPNTITGSYRSPQRGELFDRHKSKRHLSGLVSEA